MFLISIIIHGGFFINSGGNVDVTAFGGTFLRKIDCRRSPGFCALLGVDDKRKRGLFHYQPFIPTAAHRESGKRSTAKSDPSPYTNNRHHFPAGLNGQSKHSPVINDAGSPTVFPGRSIQNFPGPIHIFITVLKNIRILARCSANKFDIFFTDIRDVSGRTPMFR